MAPRFGIVPFEGFDLSALGAVIDALRVLSVAGTRCGWTILSADAGPVRAANGLVVQADAALSRGAGWAALVLVGGGAPVPLSQGAHAALVAAARQGAPILALGCGPVAQPDRGRAGRAGQDGAIRDPADAPALIRAEAGDLGRLFGHVLAGRDLRDDALSGRSGAMFGARDPLVVAALHAMQQNLETARTIEDLSLDLRIGRRKMERHFRADIGQSPHSAYAALRLDRAIQLLHATQDSLSEIALACGFCDSSHLVRVMKTKRGVTPGELRKPA